MQVIERGGTFFVVFMDSNQMPAPLRIKNLSDVPIQFYQSGTREELTYLRAFIQPQQSINYAWDEMTFPQAITCSIVGGTRETFDMQKLGQGENLCYENHICLVLQRTVDEPHGESLSSRSSFQKSRSTNDRSSSFPLPQRHQLVIDYVQGKLVLAPREENKRSQLWRMTSSGILVHTGSSSPRDWSKKNDTSDDIRKALVLDIEEVSNSSLYGSNAATRPIPLTIGKFDPKRTVTQTWTFHDEGYLSMGQTQMCVQVLGELKVNSELVLGPCRLTQQGGVLAPLPTMHIRPLRRLKGSGLLSVRTYADGPTRVLEIADVKTSHSPENLKAHLPTPAVTTATSSVETVSKTLHRIDVRLAAGIGVSIISSMGPESEELVYVIFNDIHLEYSDENDEQSVEGTIGTIIVSNQLLMTSTLCLLYAAYEEDSAVRSAVRLQASLQKPNANYK